MRPTLGSWRGGTHLSPSMRSCSRWGLPSRPRHRDRWCALTAPFHPCPQRAVACAIRAPVGGLLSVALSVGSRPLGVTQHLALWSSDFPRPVASVPACAAASAFRPRSPGRLGTQDFVERLVHQLVGARVPLAPHGLE